MFCHGLILFDVWYCLSLLPGIELWSVLYSVIMEYHGILCNISMEYSWWKMGFVVALPGGCERLRQWASYNWLRQLDCAVRIKKKLCRDWGRVAMWACMGYIVPEYFRWPGYCSPSTGCSCVRSSCVFRWFCLEAILRWGLCIFFCSWSWPDS